MKLRVLQLQGPLPRSWEGPQQCPEILQLKYERNLRDVFQKLTIPKMYMTLPTTCCEVDRNFLKTYI